MPLPVGSLCTNPDVAFGGSRIAYDTIFLGRWHFFETLDNAQVVGSRAGLLIRACLRWDFQTIELSPEGWRAPFKSSRTWRLEETSPFAHYSERCLPVNASLVGGASWI